MQLHKYYFCAAASFFTMMAPASAASPLTQADLDIHRALWNSHQISDYDFILGRSCFCEPDYILPAFVSVRMGSIVSVTDVVTHQPRSTADFYTVDQFFDSLQFALDTDPSGEMVEYDEVLGFPRFIRFDDPDLFDDDINYGISNLMVVPEPGGLILSLTAITALATWATGRYRPEIKRRS